jgi:hypothetical protein
MKSLKKISTGFKSLIAFLMLCFVQTMAFAQDKKVDVNISTDKGGGNWYAQPWVWIVGGAVFLLLLVALMRGNSNKD